MNLSANACSRGWLLGLPKYALILRMVYNRGELRGNEIIQNRLQIIGRKYWSYEAPVRVLQVFRGAQMDCGGDYEWIATGCA